MKHSTKNVLCTSTSKTLNRGTLTVLIIIFATSAALRLTSGSGVAIAQELQERAGRLNEADPDDRDSADLSDITPELIKLLHETKKRSADLDKREQKMKARTQVLELIEREIKEDIQRLEDAEANLRATMSLADQAAEQDISQLTSLYENMKPAQASELFELMEPSFAAGFLARMRSDAAAAVMAGLSPDHAYTISVVLAGRNAEVPREQVPAPDSEFRSD